MPDMNEHSETQQEWLGITEHKKECWKDCTEPSNTLIRQDIQYVFRKGAEFGYNKANEYAKVIIQDLLDNSDEYARQRAIDWLQENEK